MANVTGTKTDQLVDGYGENYVSTIVYTIVSNVSFFTAEQAALAAVRSGKWANITITD